MLFTAIGNRVQVAFALVCDLALTAQSTDQVDLLAQLCQQGRLWAQSIARQENPSILPLALV